jgi:glycosyltransferase involved in cell wall biosynthesis
MNILFLMIAYPDITENSSMYTDLAIEFQSRGNEVFVAVANGPEKNSFRKEGGVNVLRVRTMELFSTSVVRKGIGNILLPYQLLAAIKNKLKGIQFDAIVLATPPVTYSEITAKLKRKYRCRVYLVLRDIFPQNARDLGLIRHRLIYDYFRRKEKKLYSTADFIGCMSPGNIEYISRHNPEVDSSKLHLLQNWKNISKYTVPDYNFKKENGLDGKIVVLYGGNLGKPQDVDFIIELAESVKSSLDIVFLIVGNGTEKKRMDGICQEKKLKNIIFRAPLPRSRYEELAKICDIGLVVNNRRFTIPNIPSRSLSYWEAKIPILAAVDPYTDYGTLLEKTGSGLWSLTGDIEACKRNLELLCSSEGMRREMGENGYRYLLSNCSTAVACNTISDHLLS